MSSKRLSPTRHDLSIPRLNLLVAYIPRRLLLACCHLVACLCLGAEAFGQESAESKVDFEQRVLPILRTHCFDCHSHEAGEASGRLMLDSLLAMEQGGTRGKAIVPSDPQASLILTAMEFTDSKLQMPPDGQLEAEEIDVVRQWIAGGAHVPKAWRGEATAGKNGPSIQELTDSHWAYQLPQRWQPQGDATLPEAFSGNAIDAILRTQQRERRLSYSPRADRQTLVKRAYYDLLGLPPTAAEVERFVAVTEPDDIAFEQLVDSLLASPHFGERWGRYWMDIARYADNKGYVFREDREYAEAYRYRDWLVQAFNQDQPFTEFVTKQLAADLLVASGDAVEAEVPALGFLTLGRRFLNNKFDIVDDRLDVVSRGLMGMTLACARCHDHKYDPVTQKDYYALAGVFLNTEEPGDGVWPHRMQDAAKDKPSFVLIRGSPGNRGEKVPKRFVGFLSSDATPLVEHGSGRRELANKIASENNPLTARVFANRVWMRLTGQSLVETPSDFGTRCPPPVQLALLDHLATDFMAQRWSMKSLIRQIMLSDCYAQQSLARSEPAKIDPANDYYWRMNRRRLDFEALRDTLLERTGGLERHLFGKSQAIHAAPFPHRRTVYAYIDRQNLPSIFRTFDLASPDAHNPRRAETTVPQQGLFLLNSAFIAEQAEALATRLEGIAQVSQREAIRTMFQMVLAREPEALEVAWVEEFLAEQRKEPEIRHVERWVAGYAKLNADTQSISDFRRLPFRTETGWQGGDKLPDSKLGWCLLTPSGGHPGNDAEHAVVRRWIAPRDGSVRISGKLVHRSDQGDGVRATLINGGQPIQSWRAHNKTTGTRVNSVAVVAGENLDFVTDCLSSPSHDGFDWIVKIEYSEPSGTQHYASDTEFPRPAARPLSIWAQAVQALLASNEIAFLD